jgi:Zn-dependent peptidase ImmA (M78 family)
MTQQKKGTVLSHLRDLTPARALTPSEVRQVIERQTTRLLALAEVPGPPVPIETVIALLSRIVVKRAPDLPTSGRTQWAGAQWIILVSSSEAPVRQRFSLGHELAHVVYHPLSDTALPAYKEVSAEQRLEQACEYFSACLLMPRTWVKRAYYNEGIHDVPGLARLFDVSWVAAQIRLEQLGLVPRLDSRPLPAQPRSAA